IGMWRFRKKANKADPIQLAHLIREKTDKEEAGFSCRINQQSWLDINEKINFPLASLTQIIIALDYAKQASAKKIDPKKIIKIEEVNRLYITKTEKNAQENWLASINQSTDVTLKQVDEVMVTYSSNEN